MPAKLWRSGDPSPILFGAKPGFGISYGFEAPLNQFWYQDQNPNRTEQYVNVGTGFGNEDAQCSAGSNLDNAALTPGGGFVEDLSSNTQWFGLRGATPALSGPDPRFYSFRCCGTAGVGTRAADDGIECFDAYPTNNGSLGFNALYLGNRCQSYVSQFNIGTIGSYPTLSTQNGIGFTSTAGQTTTINFSGSGSNQTGSLIILIFVRYASALNDLPAMPGWTQDSQLAASPTTAGAQSMTVYTHLTTNSDSFPFGTQITTPTAFTGFWWYYIYTNVDLASPVEVKAIGQTSGTSTSTPSVTTLSSRTTVAAIFAKLSTNTFPAFGMPAGWTSEAQSNFGHPAGTGAGINAWLVLADQQVASPSTINPTGFTGADASSFGTGFTISMKHGPGLTSTATTGSLSYGGLQFQPDIVLFTLCNPIRDPTLNDIDSGNWMFGAADSSLNQFVTSIRSSFGSGALALSGILDKFFRYRRFKNDACIHFISAAQQFIPSPDGSTGNVTAALTSMNSDGFTLNITENPYSFAVVSFMAIKADPGHGHFAVGNGVASGSTGTQAFTGLGFQPEAVMVAGGVTTDTALHNDLGAALVGVATATKQTGGWMENTTSLVAGSPPAGPPQSYVSDTHIYVAGKSLPGPLLLQTAKLQSLDSGGFTLNWDLNDGAARLFGWIAMQVDSATTLPPVGVTVGADDIVCAGTHCFITFHGLVTPNSIPGRPVSYSFELWNNPGGGGVPGSLVASTGFSTDGSGTSTVAVTLTLDVLKATFDPTTTPFCYRIVVKTRDGCQFPGNYICVNQPQSRFTFGNKFRVAV